MPARVDAVSHYFFLAVTGLIGMFTGQAKKGGIVQKMIDGLVADDWRRPYATELKDDITGLSKKGMSDAVWLSSDPETRKKYAEDEECGADFTLGYWNGIHDVNWNLTKDDQTPLRAKPVLCIIGAEDPICCGPGPLGAMGDKHLAVKQVLKELQGVAPVKVVTYNHTRHEVHNDFASNEMYEDIANWILSDAKFARCKVPAFRAPPQSKL